MKDYSSRHPTHMPKVWKTGRRRGLEGSRTRHKCPHVQRNAFTACEGVNVSPSIIVLGPDTALGVDVGLSLSLDHDPEVRHQPCLLGVPMMGRKQHGYITSAFSRSLWWGEINLEKSGCGGNEQNGVKKGGNG